MDEAAHPDWIPIFPLENVVLFPRVRLPLHIFEPRYRQMTRKALAGPGRIGMVTAVPERLQDTARAPSVFNIGCEGIISDKERLSDGRYNIVLDGLMKFRILSEDASRAYRLAEVEALPEVVEGSERPVLAQSRRQLERALRSFSPAMRLPPADLADEDVVDGVSAVVPLAPADRQELLEADGPIERATRLIGFLAKAAVPL